MGNKGRGEKTKMNKGRREGQGERANNNKEFSYVFVWCLFRSLIGPKSGQNPKKKKHPNLQPHLWNQKWDRSIPLLTNLDEDFFVCMALKNVMFCPPKKESQRNYLETS